MVYSLSSLYSPNIIVYHFCSPNFILKENKSAMQNYKSMILWCIQATSLGAVYNRLKS